MTHDKASHISSLAALASTRTPGATAALLGAVPAVVVVGGINTIAVAVLVDEAVSDPALSRPPRWRTGALDGIPVR